MSDGAIDVRNLRVAGIQLERGSIKVQGRGAPDAWDGSLALELAGAGAPWPGLSSVAPPHRPIWACAWPIAASA